MGCGGCCGPNDWCAGGTMCSNCKGGFYPPITCGGCNTGCCPGITFPCVFGASVNNPGCECCKEKTPPGKCKWPCMWPCCCTCTPPKFEFKPLKPEPVCHCPSPHSHHTACGHHCLKRTGLRLSQIPTLYCPISHNHHAASGSQCLKSTSMHLVTNVFNKEKQLFLPQRNFFSFCKKRLLAQPYECNGTH